MRLFFAKAVAPSIPFGELGLFAVGLPPSFEIAELEAGVSDRVHPRHIRPPENRQRLGWMIQIATGPPHTRRRGECTDAGMLRIIEAEVARLEQLGARRIADIRRWVVMEAPTGQRFCVVNPQAANFNETANRWN